MTREEANHLLEEHKLGIRIHPVVEITKALWVTGDLKGVRRSPEPSSEDGENPRMERTGLVSSQRT